MVLFVIGLVIHFTTNTQEYYQIIIHIITWEIMGIMWLHLNCHRFLIVIALNKKMIYFNISYLLWFSVHQNGISKIITLISNIGLRVFIFLNVTRKVHEVSLFWGVFVALDYQHFWLNIFCFHSSNNLDEVGICRASWYMERWGHASAGSYEQFTLSLQCKNILSNYTKFTMEKYIEDWEKSQFNALLGRNTPIWKYQKYHTNNVTLPHLQNILVFSPMHYPRLYIDPNWIYIEMNSGCVDRGKDDSLTWNHRKLSVD